MLTHPTIPVFALFLGAMSRENLKVYAKVLFELSNEIDWIPTTPTALGYDFCNTTFGMSTFLSPVQDVGSF
jgi:hypothetical protein